MTKCELMNQVEQCGNLFYQNNEKKAYDTLAKLIPEINELLQEKIALTEQLKCTDIEMQRKKVLEILQELVNAYQNKDGLALADLLCYDILEELNQLSELKQGARGV